MNRLRARLLLGISFIVFAGSSLAVDRATVGPLENIDFRNGLSIPSAASDDLNLADDRCGYEIGGNNIPEFYSNCGAAVKSDRMFQAVGSKPHNVKDLMIAPNCVQICFEYSNGGTPGRCFIKCAPASNG